MTTLAIETSTATGSIAVERDGAAVFFAEFPADRGSGARMFPLLQEAAAAGGVDRVLVGLGPGSYSGVRIAIAGAAGWCLGKNLPLFGAPSSIGIEEPAYRFAGDARRGAFHCALVRDGRFIEEPRLVGAEEVASWDESVPLFVPDPHPALHRGTVRRPTALGLARAVARFPEHLREAPLEPIYLRDPHITVPKATPSLRKAGDPARF